MQIYILGTSGDSITTSRQLLNSGGVVFKTNNLQCHYDPGPGALLQMQRAHLNTRNTNLLLLSHNHLNHAAGATEVISAMTYDLMDVKGVVAGPKVMFEQTSGITIPKKYLQSTERVLMLSSGDKIQIEDFLVDVLYAHHNTETLGFIIKYNNIKIGVPSDTKYDFKLFESYQNCDLLILNMVYGFNYNDNFNLSADNVVEIIKQCKPKSVLITHFGMKVYNIGPMYITREIKQKIENSTNIITARDLLVLDYHSKIFNPRMLN